MADHDQVASTIDQLENRLASLHDLGVDTAALRSQLAFARTQLNDGRVAEALEICEEVAATAKRLANGSAPVERPRTGRFTRDQLAETLHDVLAQGMFAKLMAEHRSGPDIRLEARLNEMDEKVRAHVAHEVEALRAEQLVMRNAQSAQNVAMDDVRTVSERLPDESAPVVLDSEPAWAQALSNTLQAVAERLQSAPVTESGAPAWSQGLQDALEAVAARLQPPVQSSVQSSAQPELTSAVAEPTWSVTLREALASAEARHQELLAAVLRMSGNSLKNADEMSPTAELPATESLVVTAAGEPAWAQSLSNTLQAVGERLQSVPVIESGAPAWSQGLQDALQAVAARLQSPAQPPFEPPVQPPIQPQLTGEVAEPAWSVTLREVLASAEARHQELLAAVVRSPANSSDTALGDQLATALERGLHDLGTLLAERPSHSAMPMSSSSDDVHEALTRVTAKVFDHSTTRAIAHTTTRADRPAIATVSDSDLVKRLVAEEVEAHLGRHGTEVFTNKNIGPDDIRALVMDEMEKARGAKSQRIEANDQRAVLLRLLPTMLSDDSVRQSLFAVLAMEAVSKPGALGELTGLRAFLRRELAHAAEEMGSKLEAV